MLPQSSPDRDVQRRRAHLAWVHTTRSTRHLATKIEAGTATIQKVTISYTGGRWQASLSVRYLVAPAIKPVKHHGGIIGLDAGIAHLATVSRPVPGLTDDHGHIANPRCWRSSWGSWPRSTASWPAARRAPTTGPG